MSSEPRWEFRIFAPEAEDEWRRLASLLETNGRSTSKDLYLVNLLKADSNPKIREGELQIKRLVDTADGFERWRPEPALTFPLGPDEYHALIGERPAVPVDAGTFVDRVRRPAGPAAAMHVLKRRQHFRRGDVLAETAKLTVNGAALQSLAIESTDLEALRELRDELDLSPTANASYVQQFLRLTGDARLPKESPCRAVDIG